MQYCPVCGRSCHEVYRDGGGWGNVVGCEHCHTSPKIRCPKCGELCRKVYRTAKHGDFIGCDVCVSELDAVADADANPKEYGLEETE